MRKVFLISLCMLASCSSDPMTDCKKVAQIVAVGSSENLKASSHEKHLAFVLSKKFPNRGAFRIGDWQRRYTGAYTECRKIETGNSSNIYE